MSGAKRQRLSADAAEWRGRHLPGQPGKIMADPELRRFVERLLPRHTFAEIVARCRERFGAERAPSRSGLSRFWRQKQAGR